MIKLKKRKLKLKKKVWVIFIIILLISIGSYAGIQIHKDKVYKSTIEYKLSVIGYQEDEINLLKEKTNENIINNLLNQSKDELLLSIIKEKYYLKKNLERYMNYASNNKNISPKNVIAIVNTNNDYKYYDHDIDTDTEKDYLLIVNKFYHLKEDYEPNDLVEISNNYYYGSNHKARQVVYNAFKEMWNKAHEAGYYLIINSSYRPYANQVSVYDEYKNTQGTTYADTIAARPGYSEHQTGLALDIFCKTHTTISNFKDSEAYEWLKNNAYQYGFIERYQKEFENITGFSAEEWHWRYVGVEAATYIHNNNISFDEYYAYFIEKDV